MYFMITDKDKCEAWSFVFLYLSKMEKGFYFSFFVPKKVGIAS
jgi:hypothetical protein